MVFTPIDPTKAEVRTTQVGTQLQFDFYIPRGATGAPGGIVLGEILADGTDLNLVVTPGTYRQAANSGTPGSLLSNYPVAGFYGTINVFGTTGSDVWQEAFQQSYNGAADARKIFRRAKSNGAWSPWRAYNSTRVDNTAGRAIYQWDDSNNREQLIYGDTGARDIAAGLINGWTGTLAIRRNGPNVQLTGTLNGSARTSDHFLPMASIPGFRPANLAVSGIAVNTATDVFKTVSNNSTNLYITNGVPATYAVFANYMVGATEAWPTSLPGTAVGAIPNL